MKNQSATDSRPLRHNPKDDMYMEFWGCSNFSINTFKNTFVQRLVKYKAKRNVDSEVYCYLAIISNDACNHYVIRC